MDPILFFFIADFCSIQAPEANPKYASLLAGEPSFHHTATFVVCHEVEYYRIEWNIITSYTSYNLCNRNN